MKKIFLAFLTAWVCLSIIVFAGCSNDRTGPDATSDSSGFESDTDGATEALAVKVRFTENGATDYRIITPLSAEGTLLLSSVNLQTWLKKATGIRFETGNDYYNTSNENYQFPKHEILVGRTNRPESEELFNGLAYDDYVIAVKNEKLIIIGGNDDATAQAVAEFSKSIDKLESGEDLTLEEGILKSYDHDYGITSMKIGGIDISEFKVIYQSSQRSRYSLAAEKFVNFVQKKYGITLECGSMQSSGDSAYEIVFGDCGASGYSDMPSLKSDEVCIYKKGNKVFVGAGADFTMKCYAESRFDEYIKSKLEGNVVLDIPEKIEKKTVQLREVELENGAGLRFMTSNVLSDGTISSRAPIIIQKIMEYYPDVVGLQECSGDGHLNIVRKLSEFYGTGKTVITGTSSMTYTPILYRLDKFNLIDSGVDFFRKRYTGTNTKTMAWVVLEEIGTGKKIAVINAHYSLILASYNLAPMTNAKEGAEWRKDNSAQIIEKAEELKNMYGSSLPVFIMGDLNSACTTESIKMLENIYDDAMNVATVGRTTGLASFHSAPGISASIGKPIDYIFVDSAVTTVYRHKILTDSVAIKMSDHCPVVIDVSLK